MPIFLTWSMGMSNNSARIAKRESGPAPLMCQLVGRRAETPNLSRRTEILPPLHIFPILSRRMVIVGL